MNYYTVSWTKTVGPMHPTRSDPIIDNFHGRIYSFPVHHNVHISSTSKEVSKLKSVLGSCRKSRFRSVGKVCCSEMLPFSPKRCKRTATLALPSIKGCSSRKVTRSGCGSSLLSSKFTSKKTKRHQDQGPPWPSQKLQSGCRCAGSMQGS